MPSETKHAFVTSVEQSYGKRLRRFVSARLRNAAADTQDIMQEVYLRLPGRTRLQSFPDAESAEALRQELRADWVLVPWLFDGSA